MLSLKTKAIIIVGIIIMATTAINIMVLYYFQYARAFSLKLLQMQLLHFLPPVVDNIPFQFIRYMAILLDLLLRLVVALWFWPNLFKGTFRYTDALFFYFF